MVNTKSAWRWIPPLYFIEGLPNAIVGSLAVMYYTSMGMSNADTAMLTSGLYLPWVLKGLWGAVVDSISTKRKWIAVCTSIFALCFGGLAIAGFMPCWIAASALMFWILGFASATFDISADGFYMLALDEKRQSFFVGIRNAVYRIAALFGQGAMLIIAGKSADFFESTAGGWAIAFLVCLLIALVCVPLFVKTLPYPLEDIQRKSESMRNLWSNIKDAICEFFSKKNILSILAFVLFYRFAEAQLVKIVQPFLRDSVANGGLGMSLERIGLLYGTFAAIALFAGGILGGIFISKIGLKRAIFIMALAINLPNIIYVYLAFAQPQSDIVIGLLISLEQFGYGFGFAGYMVYLMYASSGGSRTSSYALFTSFMALGMMLPGFFSGLLQETLGYLGFFEWILCATLVSFFVTYLAYRTINTK